MSLNLKFESVVPVTLTYTLSPTPLPYDNDIDYTVSALGLDDGVIPAWTAIPSRAVADLACRNSELLVTSQCHSSCLLDESFLVSWSLVNNESGDITNVRLVTCPLVPSCLCLYFMCSF